MTEQYTLRWNQVAVERGQIVLPKTKNGHPRVIPLNSAAITALEALRPKACEPKDAVFPPSGVDRAYKGHGDGFRSQ